MGNNNNINHTHQYRFMTVIIVIVKFNIANILSLRFRLQLARADADLMGRSLDANLKEFKKFHATRKFRAVAKAVIAIRRMSKAFGNTDSGASTPTEYNPEADGMKPELSSNAVSALEE